MARTFEKITYRPEGASRSKTVILRDPQQNGNVLRGVQVTKTGDEVCGKDFDERLHVIEISLIKSRTPLRWNLHYGELEADPAAS